MIISKFTYVCHHCNELAHQTGEDYKGLVNLDVQQLGNYKINLKLHCFTCEAVEIIKLDGLNEKDITPTTRLELQKSLGIKES